MNLRGKTLIIIGVTLIVLIFTLYMVSQALIIHSFDEIDENNARRNMEIIQGALLKDMESLNDTAQYMSKNFDTSLLSPEQESNYIKKNLTNQNFINSRINLVVIYDSSKRVLYSKALDLEKKEQIPVSDELKDYISNGSINSNSNTSVNGVLALSDNPMIISIWPISSGNNRSTSYFLMVGRYFNSEEIERNTGIKTSEIKFIPHTTQNIYFNEIDPSFSKETPVMIQSNESNSINSFTILRDELGKAVYSLNVKMPRTIHEQFYETVLYYLLSFLIIGLVIGIILLLYLDKVILKRLSGLINDVTTIGESSDLSKRVSVTENDELQKLGNSINQMLYRLELLNNKILVSQRKYKTIFENTGTATATIEEDGKIALINKEFEKIVGYSKTDIIGKKAFLDFVADEDRKKMSHYHTLRLDPTHSHAAPRNYEFKLLTKKGNIKNIFSTASLIPETKKTLISLLDITDKKNAEKALKASEEMYKTLIKTSPDALIVIDLKGTIKFLSPRALELYGYNHKKELMGENITKFIDSSEKERIFPFFENVFNKGILKNTEFKMSKKDGTNFSGEVNVSVIKNDQGNVESFMGIIRDITHHKKIENEIKRSLNEKEMLIKEIHHRVKNNMQIITSLLNLQSSYFEDENVKSVFKESQNRVKSMAMVHEKLYQSKDLARINFADYIKSLALGLLSSNGIDSNGIKLNLDLDTFYLGIDTAIPLGLLLNEVITNSLKHAFPHGKNGTITIELRKKDSIFIMSISDDGVGLPHDLELENSTTLGMKLIMSLVDQLDADLTMERSRGTKFIIKFRELKYNKRI